LAHRFTDALNIYKKQILRDEAQGFSTNRLGNAAEDIACLSGFLIEKNRINPAAASELGDNLVSWLWARIAFCETCRGAFGDAIFNRHRQLDYCNEINDLMCTASAEENLSVLHLLCGNLPEAERRASLAFEAAELANDWGQCMRAGCRLAAAFFFRGMFKDAMNAFSEARTLTGQCGGTMPWIMMDHGFYFRFWWLDRTDDFMQLEAILDDANGASQGDQTWLAPLGLDILSKAMVRLRQNKFDDARKLFEESHGILEESGYVAYVPYLYLGEAELFLRTTKFDKAMNSIDSGRRLAQYYGMPILQADSYIAEAEVHIASSNLAQAQIAMKEAARRVHDYGYHLRNIELKLIDGQIERMHGNLAQAEEIITQAIAEIEVTERRSLLLRPWLITRLDNRINK
jgi:tetratricopeptide (TPR) repeat protein